MKLVFRLQPPSAQLADQPVEFNPVNLLNREPPQAVEFKVVVADVVLRCHWFDSASADMLW